MQKINRILYKPSEVAESVGVKDYTIHQWIKDGKLQAVHIGRRLFIPATELERLVNSATTTGTETSTDDAADGAATARAQAAIHNTLDRQEKR